MYFITFEGIFEVICLQSDSQLEILFLTESYMRLIFDKNPHRLLKIFIED